MRILKRGKVFDPREYSLPAGLSLYAKSPQAVVFDDFVRVYFSSQRVDSQDKWLSVPIFADFNKNFSKVLRVADEPAINLGSLGHFDEHGIFPFNVVPHHNGFRAYTSGWSRRKAVSIDMAIGLAHSDDGVHFVKVGDGGPLLSANVDEPCLVGDPFVMVDNGFHHMWYIYGSKWMRRRPEEAPERFYRIAYAASKDGIEWHRDSKYIIPTRQADECQALPTVFKRDGVFHMFFCYRNAFGFRDDPEHSYRLGYAFSDDLKVWHRDDDVEGLTVSESGWDSQMMCYPNTFKIDDTYFLLYNGNDFGMYGFGIAEVIF